MDGLRNGRGRPAVEVRRAGRAALARFARSLALVLALIAGLAPPALMGEDPYFDAPRIVIYPFTTSGDTRPEAGAAIATGLSDKIIALGGISVTGATPGVARPQFLTNAVAQNADYYVTGFVTTIGREVSMIAQVVSTHSGAVVWSNTWLVASLDDATSHAAEIRAAVLHHAGRALASEEDAPPAPAVTARPEPDETGGHVSNILGVFGHHGRGRPAPSAAPKASASASTAAVAAVARPTATPRPAPTATPPAPQPATAAKTGGPSIAVIDVGGDAEITARLHATRELANDLREAGYDARRVAATTGTLPQRARTACAGDPGAVGVATSTLHVDAHIRAEFALTFYDCSGRALTLDREREPAIGRAGFISVIDGLVREVVAAYRRRSPPTANRAAPGAAS